MPYLSPSTRPWLIRHSRASNSGLQQQQQQFPVRSIASRLRWALPDGLVLVCVRAETAPLLADLRSSTLDARDAMESARIDLERFDRVLGSAEAISATAARSSRVARTTLSAPMIKAAGLATGTSRAVRRLRRGA